MIRADPITICSCSRRVMPHPPYAAWAEAGAFPREKLLTLRKIDSDLEGHPTTLLPFVDVATGSLGQGLSVAIGIALHAKQFDRSGQRVFVLNGRWRIGRRLGLGGRAMGESSRPQQSLRDHRHQPAWAEPADHAAVESRIYKARWDAFGWQALLVNGHSIPDLIAAF